MKQRRFLGLFALLGLLGVLATGCISDETRGWAASVKHEDTQIVSTSKGKLDGIDSRAQPAPAWTGTLGTPLGENDTRLQAASVAPTQTVFVGDILNIGSEVVRVRSLSINGAEREMHLDRGVGGTLPTSHPAGTAIEAFRRSWRFPDDWHIRSDSARGLAGVYGDPVMDSGGTLYVGDSDGWVYAFRPDEVNLDASGDSNQPKVGLSNLDETIIGGVALDAPAGRLYAAAGERVYAISTDRLNAALEAGGGEIEPESGFFFQAGDEMWASPVVVEGTVLIASLDGKLYRAHGATGLAQWTFDGGNGLLTTPTVVGDRVLVGGFDNKLYAVDLASGELEWTYEAGNWIFGSAREAEGTVYFGDFDSVLHAVDVDSGEAEWSLELNRGKIRGAVAVIDDFIVVGTDDGWLVGVNRETRQRAWEVKIDTAIHADVVAFEDQALIAPTDCVTPAGSQIETYFRAVDPETGTLTGVEEVC